MVSPPKCKVCGKVEWRHTCTPPRTTEEILARLGEFVKRGSAAQESVDRITAKAEKVSRKHMSKNGPKIPVPVDTASEPVAEPVPESAPKLDRKQYKAEKERERRAAKGLGMTLQQFRELQRSLASK